MLIRFKLFTISNLFISDGTTPAQGPNQEGCPACNNPDFGCCPGMNVINIRKPVFRTQHSIGLMSILINFYFQDMLYFIC